MKLTRVSLMNRAPIWLLLFLRCRAYGKACDDVFKQLNLSDSRTRYDVETSIALQMLARSVRLLRAGTHASGKAEECPEKLDPRSYCEDCPVSHITVLWSYPGSGNTYTRTLIEGSTLILTGSVYIDESIALEMPGENVDVNSAKTCAKLSVIKMHPFIQDSGWASDCGISFLSICGLQAKRAIFLVRHPISAGWAEFQRRLTSSHTGNPIEAVGDMNIKKAEWFQSWKSAARTMLYEWAGMWDEDAYFGRYMETYGDGAFTILRFEDLMHPSIREVELKHVLDFAGLGEYYTDESVACAFNSELAEAFHRKKNKIRRRLYNEVNRYLVEPVDDESVSAHAAWMSLPGRERDDSWSRIQHIATVLGYTTNATEYQQHWESPILPDV